MGREAVVMLRGELMEIESALVVFWGVGVALSVTLRVKL